MPADVSVSRIGDWDDADRAALQELGREVYPPEELKDWPGRHLEWTPAEWGVRVTDETGLLVSYTGVVVRVGEHDGQSVRIGGIGGVKTRPQTRGQGHAARGIESAVKLFRDQNAAFALLVCEPDLLAYYSRLNWREFDGRLLTQQNGRTEEFTFNRVMVLDVAETAPSTGTIDLLGPPW